nr:putative reverse transcriptase domain-containing protein [Tanacetum cinerariifolium]
LYLNKIVARHEIPASIISDRDGRFTSNFWRGEYSQWRKRFMNYLEEQTDGEAMIHSIQNGDQPLPIIAQVSLAGTAQIAPPTLKDLKF